MYSCNISGYTIFLIIPVKAAAQQNFPLLMLVQCRSFISRFYHNSPILCMLHWLPVEFRIHFKIIIITFKAIHGQAPVYLQELISKREEKRYNLRSCAMGIMLQTPRTLTKKTLGDQYQQWKHEHSNRTNSPAPFKGFFSIFHAAKFYLG